MHFFLNYVMALFLTGKILKLFLICCFIRSVYNKQVMLKSGLVSGLPSTRQPIQTTSIRSTVSATTLKPTTSKSITSRHSTTTESEYNCLFKHLKALTLNSSPLLICPTIMKSLVIHLPMLHFCQNGFLIDLSSLGVGLYFGKFWGEVTPF